ncbi:hypothetical protein NQZ68_005779 [Dissostichus eleginoides]|nr:hypothetical protein NQZ68_005779 [Dissostichus eleginoides]
MVTAKTPIASTSHRADSYTSPDADSSTKEMAKCIRQKGESEATDRTEDSDNLLDIHTGEEAVYTPVSIQNGLWIEVKPTACTVGTQTHDTSTVDAGIQCNLQLNLPERDIIDEQKSLRPTIANMKRIIFIAHQTDSDNQDDNDPLRSKLLLVFMSSLMSLFTHCPMCKENSPGRLRKTMGTFVEIDQNFKHCGFQRFSASIKAERDLMPSTLEGQITMEKTPSYFVTNHAPKRIHTMARDIKLIIVVRNPVTRAISDYTQTLSKKPEINTFEVLAFKNRTLGLIDASWSALRIGIYALHLESWMQYFPLSQMHFVSGERLIVDPAGEMGKVQDFLGLKRIVTDKHFYFNKTKGFPCLKKPEDSSTPRCLGKSKGRTHPKIDPDVIRRLHKFYKPFNMMFYQMTGQNFEWELEEDSGSRSSQD